MSTHKDRLEKIEYLNNRNLEMVRKEYTGQIIVHWRDGEPMEIEVHQKKKIDLQIK